MARRIVLWFVRHGKKGKGPDPGLTDEGKAQAQRRGEKIGPRRGTTRMFSSPRVRTQETAFHIAERIRSKRGKVEEGTGIDARFSFHNPAQGEPEERAVFRITPEMHETYEKKGQMAYFTGWMEGRFKGGTSAERVGGMLADWISPFYRESLQKGEPARYIMATHGDSNVEALFYALTGTNFAEVKGKGPAGYMEGFKLTIENGKMQIELRGKKFPVLPIWKTALRKVNEAKRISVVERNIRLQEDRRKARVRLGPRNPKRRTMRR